MVFWKYMKQFNGFVERIIVNNAFEGEWKKKDMNLQVDYK